MVIPFVGNDPRHKLKPEPQKEPRFVLTIDKRNKLPYRAGVKHKQMYIVFAELCLSPDLCARTRIEKLS